MGCGTGAGGVEHGQGCGTRAVDWPVGCGTGAGGVEHGQGVWNMGGGLAGGVWNRGRG